MCFFQAVLLGGYLDAHLLVSGFERRVQALIHAAVLLAAAAFLPLDLAKTTPTADTIPVLWLISRLAISVGPPFFALSATAPPLQRWFSRTDHPAASRSLFPLCRKQCGQPAGAVGVPGCLSSRTCRCRCKAGHAFVLECPPPAHSGLVFLLYQKGRDLPHLSGSRPALIQRFHIERKTKERKYRKLIYLLINC